MGKVWKISKGATFKDVSRNIFTITFNMEADKQRVMEGHPWLFGNHLLVLKQLDGFAQPQATRFKTEIFLLQFHHLLIRCMKRYYGNLIGKSISRVLGVDVDTDDIWWEPFLRVRIEISLHKSNKRKVYHHQW